MSNGLTGFLKTVEGLGLQSFVERGAAAGPRLGSPSLGDFSAAEIDEVPSAPPAILHEAVPDEFYLTNSLLWHMAMCVY